MAPESCLDCARMELFPRLITTPGGERRAAWVWDCAMKPHNDDPGKLPEPYRCPLEDED